MYTQILMNVLLALTIVTRTLSVATRSVHMSARVTMDILEMGCMINAQVSGALDSKKCVSARLTSGKG